MSPQDDVLKVSGVEQVIDCASYDVILRSTETVDVDAVDAGL